MRGPMDKACSNGPYVENYIPPIRRKSGEHYNYALEPAQRPFFHRSLVYFVAYFVASIIWFRTDMIILIIPILVSMVLSGKASFEQLAVTGAISTAIALAITLLVDTYYWKPVFPDSSLIWPEGLVFKFNVIENRSHEYGVQPWHWYFSSALPRAYLFTIPFIGLGLLKFASRREKRRHQSSSAASSDIQTTGSPVTEETALLRSSGQDADAPPRHLYFRTPIRSKTVQRTLNWVTETVRDVQKRLNFVDWHYGEFTLPPLVFVVLYSFLPHKELRFLIPAFPLLFLSAGAGIAKWHNTAERLYWGDLKPHTRIVCDSEEGICPARPARGDSHSTIEQVELDEVSPLELLTSPPETRVESTMPSSDSTSGNLPVPPLGGGKQVLERPLRRRGPLPSITVPPLRSDAAPPPIVPTSTPRRLSKPENLLSNTVQSSLFGQYSHTSRKRPKRHKVFLKRMLALVIFTIIMAIYILSAAGTSLFIRASMVNYPGGSALQRIYTIYSRDLRRSTGRRRHIDMLVWTSDEDNLSLPPCPEGDIIASGSTGSDFFEWLRQCMSSGCPNQLPWPFIKIADFASGSVFTGFSSSLYDNIKKYNLPDIELPCTPLNSPNLRPIRLHIDRAAAETGVTRFLEAWSANPRVTLGSVADYKRDLEDRLSRIALGDKVEPAPTDFIGWVYSKAENLTRVEEFQDFDLLLTENPGRHKESFQAVFKEAAHSYIGIDFGLAPGQLPFRRSLNESWLQFFMRLLRTLNPMNISILTEPRIYILQRIPEQMQFKPKRNAP